MPVLMVRCSSCIYERYGSCFRVHSVNLYLLIGELKPLLLRAINDLPLSSCYFIVVASKLACLFSPLFLWTVLILFIPLCSEIQTLFSSDWSSSCSGFYRAVLMDSNSLNLFLIKNCFPFPINCDWYFGGYSGLVWPL